MSLKVPGRAGACTDMVERPIPIPEPQRAPHEGGNGALGLPRTVHESAKPPPQIAFNNPPLSPEERKEKKRKYYRDYAKRNKDKVNKSRRRYYHEGARRPNKKLREYQWQRHLERMAKRREQELNEQSADLTDRGQEHHEATQIFPPPTEK
jgi:hypothetical protein